MRVREIVKIGCVIICPIVVFITIGIICMRAMNVADDALIARQGYCDMDCISYEKSTCDSAGFRIFPCWRAQYMVSTHNRSITVEKRQYRGTEPYLCHKGLKEYCFIYRDGTLSIDPPNIFNIIFTVGVILFTFIGGPLFGVCIAIILAHMANSDVQDRDL